MRRNRRRSWVRPLLVAMVFGLVAPACAGDSDPTPSASPSAPATAATDVATSVTAPVASAATQGESEPDVDSDADVVEWQTVVSESNDGGPLLPIALGTTYAASTRSIGTLEFADGSRVTVARDEGKAFVATADVPVWMEVPRSSALAEGIGSFDVPTTIDDAAEQFQRTVDEVTYDAVIDHVASTTSGDQVVISITEAWYLHDGLAAVATEWTVLSASTDSRSQMIEVSTRVGVSDVAVPRIPAEGVPLAALMADAQVDPPSTTALPAGFAPPRQIADDDGFPWVPQPTGGADVSVEAEEILARSIYGPSEVERAIGDFTNRVTSVADLAATGKAIAETFQVPAKAAAAVALLGSNPVGWAVGGYIVFKGAYDLYENLGKLEPQLNKAARAWGDPHLVSFDGVAFDFQMVGEFVALRSDDVEVHVRFEGARSGAPVSFFESVAMRFGGHTVQVIRGEAVAFVDGQPVETETGTWLPGGGYLERHGDTTTISAPDGTYVAAGGAVTVGSTDADADGLFGTPNGVPDDDFVTRDGTPLTIEQRNTVAGLYELWGESWRVDPGERLFVDEFDGARPPIELVTLPSLSLFTAAERERGAAECRAAGIAEGALLDTCVYDVLADPAGGWAEANATSTTAAAATGTSPTPGGLLAAMSDAAPAGVLDAIRDCDLDALTAALSADPAAVATRDVGTGRAAVGVGVEAECPAAVDVLLDAGANPNALADDGTTPLLAAARTRAGGIVELLVTAGADVDGGLISSGTTALSVAAFTGDDTIVATLLEAGADPNLTDGNGDTPLLRAIPQCHTATAELLLDAGADPATPNPNGRNPLTAAAASRCTEIVDALIRRDVDVDLVGGDGMTALSIAAFTGDDTIVATLLEAGADPNLTDGNGDTPLLRAIPQCHTATAELLLDAGADPATPNPNGESALDLTSAYRCEEIGELLAG